MEDRGFFLTLRAIRRQLAAMPNELFLVRLIHDRTRQAFPGERLWTAEQLGSAATVRFLRARNREGCDVYVQPYADDHNAGYILVDLDGAQSTPIAAMSPAFAGRPCAPALRSGLPTSAACHCPERRCPGLGGTPGASDAARWG